MLNPDPAKLRYLGIDLHSRTRRRMVVVLTWLTFVIGMSVRPASNTSPVGTNEGRGYTAAPNQQPG
jgi:hypothetical protein